MNQKHTYTIGGRDYPRVTEILHAAGLYEWLDKIPADKLEFAKERGTAVHIACQLFDEGRLGELDDRIKPYLEGWKKLRADMKWGKEVILNETTVYSNLWGVAGTLDRLFKGNILVDIKSGAVSNVVGLQTAAYAKLLLDCMGIKVKQRFSVQLCDDGTYKLTEFNKLSDWQNFLAALKIYQFKKKGNLI